MVVARHVLLDIGVNTLRFELFMNSLTNDLNCYLHVQLRHNMILWQELLEALGGMLEWTKCFYYVLSWQFNEDGKATPITKFDQRKKCDQIKIFDINNKRQPLLYKKRFVFFIKH